MRTKNPDIRQRLLAALRRGPVRATDLARQAEVSPRTVLRLLGELGAKVWQPPLPLPGERAIWLEACRQALVFWNAAASDRRISEPLRKVFRDNANRLDDTAGHV